MFGILIICANGDEVDFRVRLCRGLSSLACCSKSRGERSCLLVIAGALG